MKKILLILTAIILVLPIVVNAAECDVSKVTIESIEVTDKTSDDIEKSSPTISGRNIKLDLLMQEVGDRIEYKFKIKNDSNEPFDLDKNNINASTDYINYSFETQDNTTIIQPKETKEVKLIVQYKSQVPDSQYTNGVYKDNKNIQMNLSNNTGEILNNPNTGASTILFIFNIILLTIIIGYIYINSKKYRQLSIFIICLISMIPLSVYALCKCDINIESNVEISKMRKMCIYNDETKYDFIDGMTYIEWKNSSYYNPQFEDRHINIFEVYNHEACINAVKEKYQSIDTTDPNFDWDTYNENYYEEYSQCETLLEDNSLLKSDRYGCYNLKPM